MDVLSIILLVVGLVVLILGILKVTKNSQVVGIIGVVLLIFGILGGVGVIDYSSFSQGQAQGFAGSNFQQQQPISSACSANAITSNGKSQADVLYRNVENSSLSYIAAAVSANSGGSIIDSSTTNAGVSASYVSLSNIPNCGAGDLIATVTTGVGVQSSRKVRDVEKNSEVSGYSFADKAVHKYEILGSSGDVVNLLSYDNTLTANSNGVIGQLNSSIGTLSPTAAISGTGTADGTAYFANTSVGSKGSINFYADLKVNGTATGFGAYGEPDSVIIAYDSGTASRFSPNSLSLQSDTSGWSLNKLSSCPQDITNNRNAESCWSAPAMKAGVQYRVKGTLTADNGDPIVGDTFPSVYVDDKVFFRDTDGNIKYQSFSSSGTNQGVGGTILNFIMS